MITQILAIVAPLIDKIIPDKNEAAKAKLELVKLEQEGNLKEAQVQLSAIIAEANSTDKWTSRARPSFLYVVYLLLLTSIPVGICYVVAPETARLFTIGFENWLKAIPKDLVDLFQVVMLGYVGARSFEKFKGVAK